MNLSINSIVSALTTWSILLIAFIALCTPASAAVKLTTVYSFPVVNGTPTQGSYPSGKLVQGSDGNFYGTTGGSFYDFAGTIFKITPSGTLTTLYRFSPAVYNQQLNALVNSDGSEPSGLILGKDGDFYGTTFAGGAEGSGTVYKITPSGVFTHLYSFSAQSLDYPGANSDGAEPNPLVQGSDGNFYGTTQDAGPNGSGTVFTITPSGSLTTLYSFSATDESGRNSDGASPVSALVEGLDGNFYGTTGDGGGGLDGNGDGTIFKITPSGTLTTLVIFNSDDGAVPFGGLTLGQDGNFYGTTTDGGTGGVGTVFKMTPSGTLTTLFNFDNFTSGGFPEHVLVEGADGNFYGSTTYEGAGKNGSGTLFQVTPQGKLTTLYRFSPTKRAGTGFYTGLVQAGNGDFYGMSSNGSMGNIGTVYSLRVLPSYGFSFGSATVATAPTTVNLTQAGVIDWIDFALGNVAAFSQKATGHGEISNAIGVGNSNKPMVDAHDLRACTWSDGSPTVASTGDTSALQMTGHGEIDGFGYGFTAIADQTPRKIIIYAGGADSASVLRVSLSDGSAPDFVQTQPLTTGPYDVTYQVTYRAGSPGQTLFVTWTLASGYGTVTLAGAALRPSSIVIIGP